MVFRRRGNLGLRPINRIKHVRDLQGGTGANVQSLTSIIVAVDAPVIANSFEVETGSTVHALYLKVEAYATTEGALANCYMYVAKNPGNNLTLPNANNVGVNDNKKYIIHQEMVMLEQKINGNPRTLFNGVISIPKGYKRNGPNDRLVLALLAPGVDISFCYQAHYKEFR